MASAPLSGSVQSPQLLRGFHGSSRATIGTPSPPVTPLLPSDEESSGAENDIKEPSRLREPPRSPHCFSRPYQYRQHQPRKRRAQLQRLNCREAQDDAEKGWGCGSGGPILREMQLEAASCGPQAADDPEACEHQEPRKPRAWSVGSSLSPATRYTGASPGCADGDGAQATPPSATRSPPVYANECPAPLAQPGVPSCRSGTHYEAPTARVCLTANDSRCPHSFGTDSHGWPSSSAHRGHFPRREGEATSRTAPEASNSTTKGFSYAWPATGGGVVHRGGSPDPGDDISPSGSAIVSFLADIAEGAGHSIAPSPPWLSADRYCG